MDSGFIENVKKVWGYTDEQIKCLSPKAQKIIENGNEFRKWRLVAEALESRNCIAGIKQGDKYIFHGSGFLLPDKSTCPKMCMWAIGAFVPFSFMLYDRLGQGEDPSEFWIDRVRCLDVGVEKGGYGEVLFRLYCEKTEI